MIRSLLPSFSSKQFQFFNVPFWNHSHRQQPTNELQGENDGCPKKGSTLPVELLLCIIEYVGDRDLWNVLTTMNKEIYEASKKIVAPWPKNAIKIMEQNYYQAGFDQLAMSSEGDDSQWLLYATNNQSLILNRVRVRLWNSRTGPQPAHDIRLERTNCTDRCSWHHNMKVSQDLRYLAIIQRQERAPIVRVYDLLARKGKFEFDPTNFFELVCPDSRVVFSRPEARDGIRQYMKLGFSLDCKQIYVQYSLSVDGSPDRHAFIAIWDLDGRGKSVRASKVLQKSCYYSKVISFANNTIRWEMGPQFREWNISSDGEQVTRPSRGHNITPTSLPPEAELDPNRSWSCQASSVNPIDQSVIAILVESHYRESGHAVYSTYYYIGLLRPGGSSGHSLEPERRPAEFDLLHQGFRAKRIIARYSHHGEPCLVDDIQTSLAWFPDGKHLAFLSEGGHCIELYQVDLRTGRMEPPSTSCRPYQLVQKANEIAARECKERKSIFGYRKREWSPKYVSRFVLPPDGNSLMMVLSNNTVASLKVRPYEATYLVSI